jgi:hypothetical protein
MDSLSFGYGELDMSGNGLVFITMASVWGLTVFFNLINFGAEKKWHKAMITYGSTALLEDEEYINDAIPSEIVIEEDTILMNDQDWSW